MADIASRPSPPESESGFRPDIQGLRALAVALVVAFHFAPAQVPGGFIGVDVFFVISGFLITGHLLREVDRTGRLAVTRFWARRIRRLLPAAFVVIVISLVLTVILCTPRVIDGILLQIAASAAYLENWLLYGQQVAHVTTVLSPVEHYWSLSLEEQFYVVWPLLIVGVVAIGARAAGRSNPGRLRRLGIAIALAIILVASVSFFIAGSFHGDQRNTANGLARVWEFAAGGLVAVAVASRERVQSVVADRRLHPAIVIVSWLAVVALLATARWPYLTGDSVFAPYVIAVVAAVVLILGGLSRPTGGASWLLSQRPLQKIGDWSYSIYLWHWPILFFWLVVVGALPRLRWAVLLIAASILLAALTKHFVEDPIRTNPRWSRRDWPSFVFAAGAAVIVVATCAVIILVRMH